MRTETDIEMHRLGGREYFSRREQNLPGDRAKEFAGENKQNQNPQKSPFSVKFQVSTRKNSHGTGVAKGELR
jgi:hypothetical protein